jgi:hypothetical protein
MDTMAEKYVLLTWMITITKNSIESKITIFWYIFCVSYTPSISNNKT